MKRDAWPVAVLCSDLHFCERPPAARSAEPDWFEAMRRQWDAVRSAALLKRIPVVIAGDVFDHWKAPPSVINFAIRAFADLEIYAVPGQHDLPNHVYCDMHRSAYGTLVEAGAVRDLGWGRWTRAGDNLCLYGFPWGCEVEPRPEGVNDDCINLAVVHQYTWTGKCCYPGAPAEMQVGRLKKRLEGYSAAVVGDNHQGFLVEGKCNVFNCGGFMPRKSDERDYKPRFGLLMSDGSVTEVPFDTTRDKWADMQAAATVDEVLDVAGLIGELESLGVDALDFFEAVEQFIASRKPSDGVRKLVRKALDGGRECAAAR